VLTAAKGINLTHAKSEIPYYLQVPAEDREGFDLTRYFPQSISFIRDALETTSVMVHCLAGVSRSVCLVLAYFIKHYGLSYEEAYGLVKSRRGIVIDDMDVGASK
jgi:protein-tyrosine phosphatase